MKKGGSQGGTSPSRMIDEKIKELGDWRGKMLARLRRLIKQADPDVVEEWKWMGTPVWSHDGIICTGESYKKVVKLTFLKGASLTDPARLFNSSLDGNARRAIDIHEGEDVDESAFKALIRQVVALNAGAKAKPAKKMKPVRATAPRSIDDYIAAAPLGVQPILIRIRKAIRAAAPGAQETISYRMPAFKQHGVLIYFAAFKAHIGLYPPVSGDAALKKALAKYAGPKGNLKFPLDQPIPYALITRLARLRVKQDRARAAAKGKKR